ncbi:hypothetical protein J7T55_015500 [Diaporthe amygdali]|uniref:uncharacterized protein n=1 Tax=Phomopsis amygdali TaxID=1214568 RepID=UPI0022FE351F|nr:uncharacterized protein J7T55_015500 [Diaporthe amygdali]KAJ0120767.1 hypothetical protein J7T55_015500 [Diaporthe amygdali]
MATQAVLRLKQSGDISIRRANGNLRFPGFKQAKGCDTTVDMDEDPEIFMLLSPIELIGNEVFPRNDMSGSAQCLHTIFTSAKSRFQQDLPGGEKLLQKTDIENLPDKHFDYIKLDLIAIDPQFDQASPITIKRCLVLFTENVLDHAPTLLPSGKELDTSAKAESSEVVDLTKDSASAQHTTKPEEAVKPGENGRATLSILGKHKRATSDTSEEDHARMRKYPKFLHEMASAERAACDLKMARIDERLDEIQQRLEEGAEGLKQVATAKTIIADEAKSLQEGVRALAEEMGDALEERRRQFRTTPIVMDFNPHLQQRGGTSGNMALQNDQEKPKPSTGMQTEGHISEEPEYSSDSSLSSTSAGPHFPSSASR